MSGNNTTQPTTAAAAPVSTDITVNGRQFQLQQMTAQEGAQLYSALPTEFQGLADFYAQLAQSFERVQQIRLPSGMSFQNAWENTVNALERGRGQLDANAPQYMRDIVTQIPQLAQQIPGAGVVSGTVNGARAVAEGVGAYAGATHDFLMAFPRAVSALRVTGRELIGAAGGGIGDEQARAFGAAYAGAIFYQGSTRRAMPFIDNPFNNQQSQFWSNPLEYSTAGLEYAALNWPVVSSVWPYIEAAVKFVSQWFTTDTRQSYGDILAGIQRDGDARRAAGQTTYDALVEARMRPAERARAAEQITAAGEIAGVRTEELARLGNEGGIYTDQNGQTTAVNPGAVTPTIAANTGADGRTEGRLDRVGQAWGAVPGQLWDTTASNPLAAGLGAYTAYRVGRWVVPPVVAGGRSIAAMPVTAYGNLINTAEGQALYRTQSRFETLVSRQTALTEQIEQAQSRQAAATGSAQRSVARELKNLETQLGSVNQEIDGRRTFFGREIPGARAEFDQARAAFGERVAKSPDVLERLQRAERVYAGADRVAGRATTTGPVSANATVNAADDVASEVSRAARTPGVASAAPAEAAAASSAGRSGVMGWLFGRGASAATAEAAPAAASATRAAVAAESGVMGGLRSGLRGLSEVRGGWRATVLGGIGAGGLWLLGHGSRAAASPSAPAANPVVPAEASVGTTGTQAAAAGSIAVSTYGLSRVALSSAPSVAEAVAPTLLRRAAGPVIGTMLAVPAVVEANNAGDGHEVTRQVGGAVGGLAAGAAAGAAAGVWFGGVGAVPGAIVGGLIGYFGGSSVADYAVGDRVHAAYAGRRAELARAQAPAAAPRTDGAAGPVDPGLAAAVADQTLSAQRQALVFRNSNVSGGSTVTLSDATTAGAGARPQAAAPVAAPLVFVS